LIEAHRALEPVLAEDRSVVTDIVQRRLIDGQLKGPNDDARTRNRGGCFKHTQSRCTRVIPGEGDGKARHADACSQNIISISCDARAAFSRRVAC
jgi:hypothetical protein